MVCFGMKLETGNKDWALDECVASDFCAETNKNLGKEGSHMKLFGRKNFFYVGKGLYVFMADILIPNIALWSLPLFGIAWIFSFPLWTYTIPAFILLGGIPHTNYFYYVLAKQRLKLMGFKGSVEFVKPESIFMEVFDLWGKEKFMRSSKS